jgi:hypothetical protein
MKIQKTLALTAVILLPRIMGHSQDAGAPNQYAPVPAAPPHLEHPLSELHTPPRGLSAPELMERHQAEHRAFNEHINRQNQVFEQRQQSPPPPAPQARSTPRASPQRSGTGYRNGR